MKIIIFIIIFDWSIGIRWRGGAFRGTHRQENATVNRHQGMFDVIIILLLMR
jgi:hypothetical protein